jgi:hypothetical protein
VIPGGTSQSTPRDSVSRQVIRASAALHPCRSATPSQARRWLRSTPTNRWTACRMRLHMVYACYGTCGPFATSAIRSRSTPTAYVLASFFALPWRAALGATQPHPCGFIANQRTEITFLSTCTRTLLFARSTLITKNSLLFSRINSPSRPINGPATILTRLPGMSSESTVSTAPL